ncbi:hypothetical protein [Bowmanella denitrificans]|uniref:hypothetical protein n=1 Tax=Bowmanella denitrificans TaxID=366582 RepID=UPI000C9B8559|nr:hypothetical protein [Bowmanella denitrificans]
MIVLSLTTYGKRIDAVHLTVNSLKAQHYPVDKILLWLDQEEFSAQSVPPVLLDMQDEVFEIAFCPNYRSYKKLIPTLTRYPDATVITVDDDMLYGPRLVESLYLASKVSPGAIIGARGRLILKDDSGELAPYAHWQFVDGKHPLQACYCLIPIGYGGVLYPPGALQDSVLDIAAFSKLAPFADDIWFKCMAMLAATPTVILPLSASRDMREIPGSQDNALYRQVNVGDKNLQQFNAVIQAYPALQALINSDAFSQVCSPAAMLAEYMRAQPLSTELSAQVNLLRDCAIALEKVDMAKAFELMSMARKIRPKGPLIDKKWRQYAAALGKM